MTMPFDSAPFDSAPSDSAPSDSAPFDSAPFDADAFAAQESARFAELRARAESVRAQLAAATATVTDPRQTVTVTVGAGGVMQSLRFGPNAANSPLPQLASLVMQAYGKACREAAAQSQAIVSELVGPDSPTLQLMRDAVPPIEDDGTDELDPARKEYR